VNLGHIGAGIVVTLLPGLACLVWLERPRRDLPGYLADAVGLSVSITALVGLIFFLLGVAPGAIGTAFIYGICLATLTAALVYKGIPRVGRREQLLALGGLLTASAAVAALIWFRLYQARDLALPSWVDSVHHTLIVRLILERGGLPDNFLPYLNANFSYHYGFHLLAAHFASWAQLPPEQTVLVFGQALNGLISLSLYRFARAAGLDWRAAALAGLLAGFVFQMPAYYLTWGRYTLSTGLIVLLSAMSCALEFKDRPTDRRIGLRLALLTAGVCLTHYLATVLLFIFFVILGLIGMVTAARRRDLRSVPWQMAAWALGGGLAALPWLARVLIDNQASAVIRGLKTVVTAADWSYLINLIGPRYNHTLMILAAVGLVFGLRHRSLWSFAAWSLVLLFLAQPFAIRLGPFRPDLYVIVLFVPAAVFLGALIADGAGALSKITRPWLGRGAMIIATALLLVWGIRETRSILNQATVIANKADLQALEWVRVNTTPDARFYINPAAWLGSTNRGVDGGYWLLPFAGRFSLVPPALYVFQPPDEVRQINDWAAQAKTIKGCTAEFWTITSQARLTHVYVRQGRGSLQPAALDQCPRLRLVYREAGISIYEIEQVK
jgi:hypothetical protein